MSMYTYLYTVEIPVNYTSEFRNIFEVTFSLHQFIVKYTSIIDVYRFTHKLFLCFSDRAS